VLVPTAVVLVFIGESSVVADFLRFPVPVSFVLVLVVGFLTGQLVEGYRQVLAGVRLSTGEEETELTRLVTQLSITAGVSAPAVRVVETETPSCYTVGQFTDATVVVTTGLLRQLDSDELTTMLAHELAHVANRDVTLMTITTLFLEIADSVSRTVRLPRRALADMESLSSGERFVVRYLSVLLVIVYPAVAGAVAVPGRRGLDHADSHTPESSPPTLAPHTPQGHRSHSPPR
jgi:heat shock protein HtpX